MVISQFDPSHLPLEKPAFFMYDSARCRSPFGLARKSSGFPVLGSLESRAAASSKPGMSGGM